MELLGTQAGPELHVVVRHSLKSPTVFVEEGFVTRGNPLIRVNLSR